MAYLTGTESDVNSLLNTIRLAAIDVGWTEDRFIQTDTGGDNNGANDYWLQLHSEQGGYHSVFSTFANDDHTTVSYPKPWLRCFGATGVDLDSSNFYEQPGNSWSTGTDANSSLGSLGNQEAIAVANGLRGPFTAYDLFLTPQYIHCVIEIVPGEYAHFGFGRADKDGTWSGGEYGFGCVNYYQTANNSSGADVHNNNNSYFMSHPKTTNSRSLCTGYFKIDINGRTADWAKTGTVPSGSFSYVRTNALQGEDYHPYCAHRYVPPNGINGVAPMDPLVMVYQARDEGCYIGQRVPDVYLVNMTYLTPGEIVPYGDDLYRVFPYKRKTGEESRPEGEVNSWHYGVAYRIVT